MHREMVNEGGSEYSIIRAAFLSSSDFKGAMQSLGLMMNKEQVNHQSLSELTDEFMSYLCL